MAFRSDLSALVSQLDPRRHATEIARLQQCRSVDDLAAIARDGWLNPDPAEPRLKLVRHGSGTYLVVAYEDGWSKRVAMQPFPR